MGYEREFTKPYPNGWENIPSHDTPVTASIMDDYDDAIEHIEDFLDGSTAIFPIQATGGMTQPVGIDENGRLVTLPSGGGTAAGTSYDNTESGLEADDVQAAIDEIASDFQDGCDIIVQAVTAKGQTPASNSPQDIATAISNISGVPLLSRTDWNLLTPAQKRAYGLVGIQDSSTGFVRGDLVYGADYTAYISIYDYTTNLSETFTIDETGMYLIMLAVPYQGTGSITLPQDATILDTIDEDIGGGRKILCYIVELNANDTISMTMTVGQWAGRIEAIIKLDNIVSVQSGNAQYTSDGSTNYTLPSNNNLYLVYGLGISRTNVSRDDSTNTGGEQEMITGDWGVNSVSRIAICRGSDSPNYSFYGYDGGFSAIISWEIS